MASDEKRKLERAAKLVDVLRDLQAKTYDVTDELRKLLAGEDAIGDVIKRLEGVFSEEWERLYGTRYVFTYVKDRPHWKRLIKQTNETTVLARVMAFFCDREPYLLRARHPFGLFVSRFNSYTTDAAAAFTLDAPVVDCRHQPPCRTDQQHTDRKQAELRGSHSGPTGDVL